MKILVDTSIWSLSLRRRAGRRAPEEDVLISKLQDLIDEGRAALIGPIRQELLSGIRRTVQFEELRKALRAFPDELLTTEDYEDAAKLANQCGAAGLAASNVDLLICAAAQRRGWPVFSTDRDFQRYQTLARLELF